MLRSHKFYYRVRTVEEIELFMWSLRQDGVVSSTEGSEPSFNMRKLCRVWNREARRRLDAKEVTLKQPVNTQSSNR